MVGVYSVRHDGRSVVRLDGWVDGWMGGLAALGVCQSFGLSNGQRQWCLWVA